MGVAVAGSVRVSVDVGTKVLVLDAVIVWGVIGRLAGTAACAVHADTKNIAAKITSKVFFIFHIPLRFKLL